MSLVPFQKSPEDRLKVERTPDGQFIRVTLEGQSAVLSISEWSKAIAKVPEFHIHPINVKR